MHAAVPSRAVSEGQTERTIMMTEVASHDSKCATMVSSWTMLNNKDSGEPSSPKDSFAQPHPTAGRC